MSTTSAQHKEFEKTYLETIGICFNFHYSKTSHKWVAHTFGKRFSNENMFDLLTEITDYMKENRIEKPKPNYQFQYRFGKNKQ